MENKENISKKLNKKKSLEKYYKKWDMSDEASIKMESLGFDPSQKLYFWQDFIITMLINPKKMKEDSANLLLLTKSGKFKWIKGVEAGKFYYKDIINGKKEEFNADLTENRLYHYNNRKYWVLVSGSQYPEAMDNKIDSKKVVDMLIGIDNENKELKLALEKEKNKGILSGNETIIAVVGIGALLLYLIMSGTLDVSTIFGGFGGSSTTEPVTNNVAEPVLDNLTNRLN